MESRELYEQIGTRTGGDIYIGVVGPVRTGKSTFIKRFMEQMVLPRIDDVYKRERAKDELPQSGSGRTIMTAEPKFVPEEAAELVEFLNSPADDAHPWAKRRAELGHPAPYKVRYFEWKFY